MGTDKGFGLNFFNGQLYVGTLNNGSIGISQIFVLQNGTISNRFDVSLCSIVNIWGIISITFDSHGFMANTCFSHNTIIITDSNGTNYNKFINTSPHPYISQIDASGRFVVITMYSLDIYY